LADFLSLSLPRVQHRLIERFHLPVLDIDYRDDTAAVSPVSRLSHNGNDVSSVWHWGLNQELRKSGIVSDRFFVSS